MQTSPIMKENSSRKKNKGTSKVNFRFDNGPDLLNVTVLIHLLLTPVLKVILIWLARFQ